MIKQLRQTGGFVLEHDDFSMMVDPGPGALVYGLRNDIAFDELDAIFISHAHTDHYGDADVIIQAMTDGCTDPRGRLIANDIVLNGSDDFDPALDRFHKNGIGQIIQAEDGEQATIGDITLRFRETQHKNIQTTGFQLTYDDTTLGYVPDTEYFPQLSEKHSDTNYLIANTLRPHDNEWKGHLNLQDGVQLVEDVQPDQAFFQHFGINFVYSLQEQRDWLNTHHEEKPITLAKDNTTYSLEKEGLQQFI
jgi:phosphoribosyl 1,2-cyclic phosphodiesterase